MVFAGCVRFPLECLIILALVCHHENWKFDPPCSSNHYLGFFSSSLFLGGLEGWKIGFVFFLLV